MITHSLKMIAQSYSVYQQLIEMGLTLRHGYYRVGVVGGPCENNDELKKTAYQFGFELAKANIDIVVLSDDLETVSGQVLLGFKNSKSRENNTCKSYVVSAVVSEGERGSVKVGSMYSVHEILGGLVSDIIALDSDIESLHIISNFWQRIQFAIKFRAMNKVLPAGLCLRNTAVRIGWNHQIFCLKNDSYSNCWKGLNEAVNTFIANKTLSVERGEHKPIQLRDALDQLVKELSARSKKWENLILSTRTSFPNVKNAVDKDLIFKAANDAWQAYELALDNLRLNDEAFYRIWVCGSHRLPSDHPHLKMAFEAGYNCGRLGIDVIEGAGDDDSIMGQSALGMRTAREQFETLCIAIGNSVRLDWEDEASVERDKIHYHAALTSRKQSFLAFSADTLTFAGGPGTFLENNLQFDVALKALRTQDFHELRSLSSATGWISKVIAVGDSSVYGYLDSQVAYWLEGELITQSEVDMLLKRTECVHEANNEIQTRWNQWTMHMNSVNIKPKNPCCV